MEWSTSSILHPTSSGWLLFCVDDTRLYLGIEMKPTAILVVYAWIALTALAAAWSKEGIVPLARETELGARPNGLIRVCDRLRDLSSPR